MFKKSASLFKSPLLLHDSLKREQELEPNPEKTLEDSPCLLPLSIGNSEQQGLSTHSSMDFNIPGEPQTQRSLDTSLPIPELRPNGLPMTPTRKKASIYTMVTVIEADPHSRERRISMTPLSSRGSNLDLLDSSPRCTYMTATASIPPPEGSLTPKRLSPSASPPLPVLSPKSPLLSIPNSPLTSLDTPRKSLIPSLPLPPIPNFNQLHHHTRLYTRRDSLTKQSNIRKRTGSIITYLNENFSPNLASGYLPLQDDEPVSTASPRTLAARKKGAPLYNKILEQSGMTQEAIDIIDQVANTFNVRIFMRKTNIHSLIALKKAKEIANITLPPKTPDIHEKTLNELDLKLQMIVCDDEGRVQLLNINKAFLGLVALFRPYLPIKQHKDSELLNRYKQRLAEYELRAAASPETIEHFNENYFYDPSSGLILANASIHQLGYQKKDIAYLPPENKFLLGIAADNDIKSIKTIDQHTGAFRAASEEFANAVVNFFLHQGWCQEARITHGAHDNWHVNKDNDPQALNIFKAINRKLQRGLGNEKTIAVGNGYLFYGFDYELKLEPKRELLKPKTFSFSGLNNSMDLVPPPHGTLAERVKITNPLLSKNRKRSKSYPSHEDRSVRQTNPLANLVHRSST